MPPKKRTLLATTPRAKRYKERQSRKEQNPSPGSHRRRSGSDIARKQTDDQRSPTNEDQRSSTDSAEDPAAHSTTQEHTQRTDDATPPTETEIISMPPTETRRETQRLARDDRPTAYRYTPGIVIPNDIGRMSIECPFCHALFWPEEAMGVCCNYGKVEVPILQMPPHPLDELLLAENEKSTHFLANIRKYNSAFNMTSMGCNQIHFSGGWTPCFKVQGQVYHRIGGLSPRQNSGPQFAQLYFVGDEHIEASLRNSIIPGLDDDILLHLQRMLHANNAYVRSLKKARDIFSEHGEEYKLVIDANERPTNAHRGRYNAPSCEEVAVLMANEKYGRRDIVLQYVDDGHLDRISETHRSYDPLQYPVLFPKGEDGYSIDYRTSKDRKVSSMQFYSHMLMIRRLPNFNTLHRCRRLMQQFVVDMYVKVETERLNFLRRDQKKLRAETYSDFTDAILRNDEDPANIGQKIILPSTFTGGPRYMHQRTQDAMTYVRTFGRPSLFITMTCNPKWKEIKNELFTTQIANDRPDIIARVFNLKKKAIMKDLTKKNFFGKVQAHVCSIEWQKRGLPHSHTLLWLQKPIRSEDIDSIISAEIPDKATNPRLYDIVTSNMIHGPCGELNPNAPCMKDGQCSKGFPKQFISETQYSNDGYPLYRRRKPGEGGNTTTRKVLGREVTIDNRWVVPYSPMLSEMYDSHINVEICSSVKAIQYVIKYVNKGSDMAAFALQRRNPRDEIVVFQAARYVSCSEACWRLLGHSIHDRYPSVTTLQVHLPNGQRVLFTEDTALDVAQNPPKTKLTAYFDLCQKHRPSQRTPITPDQKFVSNLLYINVPEYFTWDAQRKVWNPRKQGRPAPTADGQLTSFKKSDVIGRMYTIHPNQSECFFVRLLLHHKTGVYSFDHLKTIDGEIKVNFREACRSMGLLEDDAHWSTAMQEAALYATASALRTLFAVILTTCQPSHSAELWETYKESMTEDIRHRSRQMTSQLPSAQEFTDAMFNEALIRLEDIVYRMSGRNLENFDLPTPSRQGARTLSNEMINETSYNIDELQQLATDGEVAMTADQKVIYDRIKILITENRGGFLFIDAPGGTGKTYLINIALAKIRSERKIALAVASSGIAAQLLPNGRTAHSTFKIPLNLQTADQPMCNIKLGTATAALLQDCAAIFWDEATMMNKKAIEALDRTLQDIRKNNIPFGGVLLILSGDFRQTLPVIQGGARANQIDACLKASHLWNNVEKYTLTTNMRVHLHNDTNAANFAALLLRIGDGQLPYMDEPHSIEIPEDLGSTTTTTRQLIDTVYLNLKDNFNNVSWLMERAILAPHNESVREINLALLEDIPGDERMYKSIDRAVDENEEILYPAEFLNSLEISGLPSHELRLKIGVPLMIVRNLAPGIANGTRVILTKMMDKCLETTIATGPKRGEKFYLPMIPLSPSETGLPFQFRRRQFPVKHCLAMTINKAQGQTLKVTGLQLKEKCFTHGQFYVGCSRVSSNANLHICSDDKTTKNVVYHEVLC